MELPKRECIQIVPFFQRRTAETASLESRLQREQVTRICVIRPNNVFYTLLESANRKLYCCLATRDNPTYAGKPIYSLRKSIVEITNLSHEGHIRIGVLCSDGTLHILFLDTAGTQHWEKLICVATDMDITQCRDIAYSRTYNALFWPVRQGHNYNVHLYDIQRRQKRVLLKSVPQCIPEVKIDSFILLFNNHGTLFVSFREIFHQASINQNSRAVDGLRGATEAIEDIPSEDKMGMSGEYWSPDSTDVVHVSTEKFSPQACGSTLRGHCLSHDRHVLYVLYGSTVYGLNGIACTPLTRIEVPDGMSSINLMFLGRITVLQSERKTAAYLNSSKPVKLIEKPLKSAGFGFVWDRSGLYQIRMCNPLEMAEETQSNVMAFSPAYKTANNVGRALNGQELACSTLDAYTHLASPSVLCVAAAYAANQENQERLIQATQSWAQPEDWKGYHSRVSAFRRMENMKRKLHNPGQYHCALEKDVP
ncbi:uncharacterized protein LOC100900900 [Galendromus occidentalis]|uniref:Uncharacterized protein LOC100900900 n=1 Tax=Galendromus occidentalis TaxID=34638 RepID=A0AAJ6QZ99_9ACAR|nr:uncharacterized protein LOC100900900 [Galendromus occidentalis]